MQFNEAGLGFFVKHSLATRLLFNPIAFLKDIDTYARQTDPAAIEQVMEDDAPPDDADPAPDARPPAAGVDPPPPSSGRVEHFLLVLFLFEADIFKS